MTDSVIAALRSPSLAGIVSDPVDTAKRIVPSSVRPDGRYDTGILQQGSMSS